MADVQQRRAAAFAPGAEGGTPAFCGRRPWPVLAGFEPDLHLSRFHRRRLLRLAALLPPRWVLKPMEAV